MFPLERYAPKSSIGANDRYSPYQSSSDSSVLTTESDVARDRVDELIIKLGEQGAMAAIENKVDTRRANNEQVEVVESKVAEALPIPGTPQPVSVNDSPFVLPWARQSQPLELSSESEVVYSNDLDPVQISAPQQIDSLPSEQAKLTEVNVEPKKLVVLPPAKLPVRPVTKESLNNNENLDVEFEKVKLGLLPLDNKVESKPVVTPNITFPVNENVNDDFAPIDLGETQKLGVVKVKEPLLSVLEILPVSNIAPEFDGGQLQEPVQAAIDNAERISDEPVNEELLVIDEKPQIVVVTPAKNEYVAPPVVNIRKQFEEYRKENRNSGYRILRNSRYSDRRNSSR